MHRRMLRTLQLGIFASVAMSVGNAQTAVVSSAPVGFMKVKIEGKAAGSGANFIGAPFVRAAVYTGNLNDGVPAPFLLSDGDASWTAGEFATSETPSHYVEVVTIFLRSYL